MRKKDWIDLKSRNKEFSHYVTITTHVSQFNTFYPIFFGDYVEIGTEGNMIHYSRLKSIKILNVDSVESEEKQSGN